MTIAILKRMINSLSSKINSLLDNESDSSWDEAIPNDISMKKNNKYSNFFILTRTIRLI